MTRRLAVVAFLLAAAACSGGDGDGDATDVAAARSRARATTTTATAASTGAGSDYGLPSETEITAPPTTAARSAAPPPPPPQTTSAPATTQPPPPPTTSPTTAPPPPPTTATTSPPTTAAPQPSTITIQNFTFNPAVLDVGVGTTVTATNRDSASHTWTADDGSWSSGTLAKDASATHTFTQAGTFTYRCDIHPSMKGTVRVS